MFRVDDWVLLRTKELIDVADIGKLRLVRRFLHCAHPSEPKCPSAATSNALIALQSYR